MALGGPRLTTLYITTARIGIEPARLQNQPAAGSLFMVETGISGLPESGYAG